MELNLNVDPNLVAPLRQVYQSRYQQAKEAGRKFMEEARQISLILSQLGGAPKSTVDTSMGTKADETYSTEWSLNRKIQFMIAQSDKSLTSKEISDMIIAVDKKLAREKSKTFKNVSTILSIENGKRYKRTKDNNKREYLYSLN